MCASNDVRRQSRGSRLVGQAASDSGGHRLLEDHSVVDEGIPVPGGVVVLPAVVADTVNWEVHTDGVSLLRSALLWVAPGDPERHDSGCGRLPHAPIRTGLTASRRMAGRLR